MATDVLVIGDGPSAVRAAVGAAAARTRINSTGASGQAMAVLEMGRIGSIRLTRTC
jgi:hypothetical protein